ncbi:hypothetical protein OK142_00065 [Agrobacterium sp. BT-220-3]|nr:hypothetical protein [Agrobacterium sp. BT-220-3]
MAGKPEMSEAVINQLTDVIAEIVAKTVDEAIDKRIATNGTLLHNRKPGEGFKLPSADGYKAPEGD